MEWRGSTALQLCDVLNVSVLRPQGPKLNITRRTKTHMAKCTITLEGVGKGVGIV